MQEEKKSVKLQHQHKDRKKMQLMYKIVNDFVPGRPGTEKFVLGFLLLDKAGQGNIFVPGQRDDGTSHPGLSRDVLRRTFRPLETLVMSYLLAIVNKSKALV